MRTRYPRTVQLTTRVEIKKLSQENGGMDVRCATVRLYRDRTETIERGKRYAIP